MNEADREKPSIRRILVALDGSPHSLAALQAAVELAKDLDAELVGLYVEDINLLRLSDLPLAREVTFYSSLPRQLNRQQIEQQLRSQARVAQRAMARLAAQAHLRWNFQVVQGVVALELLQAAVEMDLIILGKAGWSRRRRMGSTTRLVVAQAPGQAMILQQGARLALPVGVVYDGSPQSERALVAAVTLLHQREDLLTVLVVSAELDKARELQTQAAAILRQFGLQARYRWLVNGDETLLINLARTERCGILVLPSQSETFQAEGLAEVLNSMQCPVLLVR